MMNRLVVVGVVLTLLFSTAMAQSQANTADLVGVIKDQTGGVLPGVEITATNSGTDLTRSAISGDDGGYRVPLLPPGAYEVRAVLSRLRKEGSARSRN